MSALYVPFLTEEIALRVENASRDYMTAQLTALREWNGNVYDVRIQQFGEATAFLVRNAPNALFNRVMGLGPRNEGDIAALAAWYHAADRKCRLDIVPSRASAVLSRRLTRHGWYQSCFYSALYGVPRRASERASARSRAVVRAVQRADIGVFARLYVESFGLPATMRAVLEDSVRALYGNPSTRCYLASIDDTPAAVAILFLARGVGYLATSATLPRFRGRGCQTVLLEQRMADAAAHCDLVVGHTGILTESQRNMEKAGLRLAYTKALWTPYVG